MLAATKLGHAIQEHWSCHTRTKVSPRAQAHRPGELPSISELKLSGCRACSAGRDECLPRCKKFRRRTAISGPAPRPAPFVALARDAITTMLQAPRGARPFFCSTSRRLAVQATRSRGHSMLAMIVGAAVAFIFVAVPLAIIGLFIVSILDRRRGRAGEFAKRSVPVSEEAARGGEAARIRIRESRVRASRPVGAPPRPHAVAQHRKPSGEFLDAPREDCACDR